MFIMSSEDPHEMMEQMMNTLDTWHASEELIHHPLTAATTTTDTATPASSPRMKKPRKYRASKKKPATVLNANPNNFRALVQQFTGRRPRPSSAAAADVLGPRRGPINLSFSNYQYAPPPPPLQLRDEYSHHQGLISSADVFSSFLDDEGFESGHAGVISEEFPAAMDDLLVLPELKVSEAFY